MQETMNAVVGDEGLKWKFGCAPTDLIMIGRLSEKERVTAHLEFALDKLRRAATNEPISETRSKSLSALSEYISTGSFPRHEDATAKHRRLPCFIDSAGTPCAVAHLMQVSGHGDLAREINSRHRHSTIDQIGRDMNVELISWQKTHSGLTLGELALIQPTYEFVQAEKARDQFKAIMKSLEEVATPIKQGTETDVSEEVSAKMQDAIREFAVTFRNGNISEHYGGSSFPEDVELGQFGWTERDMAAFKAKIDQFESGLHTDCCAKLAFLITKLRDAAAGKKLDVHKHSEPKP